MKKNAIQKLVRYLFDSDYRFMNRAAHGKYNYMSDEEFLKRKFECIMHRSLDLEHPQTLNEKLQWLKIYDRKAIYTTMVDKYAVKDYIAGLIGEEYIIPTLGIWDKFDDIDFDALPDQFVLKCTHDSGGLVICKSKKTFNIDSARKKIQKSMRTNFYYSGREWPYKNVSHRIIAEKYMGDNLVDIKLQCFNGKFDSVFICCGRFTESGVRYHYFDRNWNYLPYCPYDDTDYDSLQQYRPQTFDKMVEIAGALAKGLYAARIDLYEIEGRIYFGEITFFSQSGFDTDITYEADVEMGKKLILPIESRESF